MDWIRRNWPDLLIGLALLAVIGGIIATLLNGGNLLPSGRNVTTTTPSSSTLTSGGNDSAIQPITDNTAISPDLPSGAAEMPGEAAGTTTSGTITPVDPASTPPQQAVTPEGIIDAPSETPGDTSASTSESTAPSEPLQASDSATAPYRISVGAFGSTENAERRAEAFRSAGYPVFVGKQGDLSLVLIGPYDSQAAAQQAAAQIQSSGLEADPIIYEFEPTDATVAGDTAAGDTAAGDTAASGTTDQTSSSTEATPDEPATTPSEATPAATEPTESTTAVSLPTSNTGRYLQVGAYGSVESAQPQLVKLQGLGFSVTYIDESDKIKLLVGPYEGTTLETAKAQLTAQGIDHFVR
jgi:cell division protein FtsN